MRSADDRGWCCARPSRSANSALERMLADAHARSGYAPGEDEEEERGGAELVDSSNSAANNSLDSFNLDFSRIGAGTRRKVLLSSSSSSLPSTKHQHTSSSQDRRYLEAAAAERALSRNRRRPGSSSSKQPSPSAPSAARKAVSSASCVTASCHLKRDSEAARRLRRILAPTSSSERISSCRSRSRPSLAQPEESPQLDVQMIGRYQETSLVHSHVGISPSDGEARASSILATSMAGSCSSSSSSTTPQRRLGKLRGPTKYHDELGNLHRLPSDPNPGHFVSMQDLLERAGYVETLPAVPQASTSAVKPAQKEATIIPRPSVDQSDAAEDDADDTVIRTPRRCSPSMSTTNGDFAAEDEPPSPSSALDRWLSAIGSWRPFQHTPQLPPTPAARPHHSSGALRKARTTVHEHARPHQMRSASAAAGEGRAEGSQQQEQQQPQVKRKASKNAMWEATLAIKKMQSGADAEHPLPPMPTAASAAATISAASTPDLDSAADSSTISSFWSASPALPSSTTPKVPPPPTSLFAVPAKPCMDYEDAQVERNTWWGIPAALRPVKSVDTLRAAWRAHERFELLPPERRLGAAPATRSRKESTSTLASMRSNAIPLQVTPPKITPVLTVSSPTGESWPRTLSLYGDEFEAQACAAAATPVSVLGAARLARKKSRKKVMATTQSPTRNQSFSAAEAELHGLGISVETSSASPKQANIVNSIPKAVVADDEDDPFSLPSSGRTASSKPARSAREALVETTRANTKAAETVRRATPKKERGKITVRKNANAAEALAAFEKASGARQQQQQHDDDPPMYRATIRSRR